MEGVGAQGKQSFVAVVERCDDKGPAGGAERLIRRGEEKWAGRRRGSRASGNSEPMERTNEVTGSSGVVDNAALRCPIRGGAVGVSSVGQHHWWVQSRE